MSQSGMVLVILVGVVGAIVLLGAASQWLTRTPRGWRSLADRFPAQPPATDAARTRARILVTSEGDPVASPRGCLSWLMPWTWARGMVWATLAIDDDHLHLDLDSGPLGPKAAMSLPWAAVETGQRADSHMGEVIELRVDAVVLIIPTAQIERELAVRALLEREPDNWVGGEGTHRDGADAERDALVIDRLQRQGVDTSVQRELEFHLDFPTRDAALMAAADLESVFTVEAPMGPGGRVEGWSLTVRRMMAPELDALAEITAPLKAAAARHGGRYDGWGTLGNRRGPLS